MLRAYVSYKQNDWEEKLTAAEFVCNSAPNASTGYSPFRLNAGQDPEIPASLFTPKNDKVQSTTDFLLELDNLTKRAKDNLAIAKERQERFANQSRRELTLHIGDRVLLSTKNIQIESQSQRPTKKLQARFIGPFPVIKVISAVAYELDLPSNLRIHPVFHISLLKPYKDPGEVLDRPLPRNPPPTEIVDDYEEFEVEHVLDKRQRRRRTEYLVEWKGYPPYEATWEPQSNLKNASEAIRAFEDNKGGITQRHNDNEMEPKELDDSELSEGETENSIDPSVKRQARRVGNGNVEKKGIGEASNSPTSLAVRNRGSVAQADGTTPN